MVHGLGGSHKDWRALVRLVHQDARLPHMMIHASEANSSKQTLQGVYSCGDRLAQEINTIVHGNPGLHYFSIIGHSFGGLLSRCDPQILSLVHSAST
jgi:thioesterase domain-containing protein